jgi:phage protein D
MAKIMAFDYSIKVDGKELDRDFIQRIQDVEYTDNLGFSSDTINVNFGFYADKLYKLFPKGTPIELEIIDRSVIPAQSVNSGALFVDTRPFGIQPDYITIGANSKPTEMKGFDYQICYSKKRVTLAVLLQDVLKEIGFDLNYNFMRDPLSGWNINLKNVAIQNQAVGAVVSEYADMFGCYVKIYDSTLIFTNLFSMRGLSPTVKIDVTKDPVWNLEVADNTHVPTDYAVSYYDPRTGKRTHDKKHRRDVATSKSETVNNILAKVADPDAARAVAMAVDSQTTQVVNYTTVGNTNLIAGAILRIEGLRPITGDFLVTRVSHNLSDSWTCEVDAERIS